MTRLQSCVQPYQWPLFFPREALYGTVSSAEISFSRFGSSGRFDDMYQFTGTIEPSDSGAALVGDVQAKWYWRVYFVAFICIFLGFFAFANRQSHDEIPWQFPALFSLWIAFVYGMMTISMRRSAEGTARYIALVVGNAFSHSPPEQIVR